MQRHKMPPFIKAPAVGLGHVDMLLSCLSVVLQHSVYRFIQSVYQDRQLVEPSPFTA